ncbi:condensation domain-containing protein [Streptomyces lydicus]
MGSTARITAAYSDNESAQQQRSGTCDCVGGCVAKRTADSSPGAPAFALSHAQRGLWLHELLGGAQSEHHLPMWFDFHQEVDKARMQEALDFIVAQHDSLRLVFSNGQDGPRQRVLARHGIDLPFSDLSDRENTSEVFESWVTEDNSRPFDFGLPLIKGHLFKLAHQQFRLYLNVHHLISHGLSNGILRRDLQTVFGLLDSGRAPVLQRAPSSYESHVREEQAWIAGREGRAAAAYWRSELAPPLPRLRLADQQRPAGSPDGSAFATTEFTLDAVTAASVRELARDLRVTVNTLLMTSYAVALRRLTGDDDLVIGVPFSGRYSADAMTQVGLFANLVAIRVKMSSNTSLSSVVAQLNEKSLLAYEHGRYPFDLVVEEVNPRRDGGRNPVFLTIFQISEFLPPKHMAPHVDAGFYGKPTCDGFEFRVNYPAHRLSPGRASDLVRFFLDAIGDALTDPTAALAPDSPPLPDIGAPAHSRPRGGRLQQLIDTRNGQRQE